MLFKIILVALVFFAFIEYILYLQEKKRKKRLREQYKRITCYDLGIQHQWVENPYGGLYCTFCGHKV